MCIRHGLNAPSDKSNHSSVISSQSQSHTLCSHGFLYALCVAVRPRSSLTFTIDLNQIDGGSQCLVVIASHECGQPTRNYLVVKLPVGMTSVTTLRSRFEQELRAWMQKVKVSQRENPSLDFFILLFTLSPTGRGRATAE